MNWPWRNKGLVLHFSPDKSPGPDPPDPPADVYGWRVVQTTGGDVQTFGCQRQGNRRLQVTGGESF